MNSHRFLVTAGLAVLALPVSGATLTDDFSGFPTTPGTQIAPGGGWSINQALGTEFGTGDEGPLSFISSLGVPTFGNSGALGGAIDTPDPGSTIYLNRSLDTPLDSFGFSLDFAIAAASANGEDNFGFAVRDGSNNNLFSINFERVPMDTDFQVTYTVGGGSPTAAMDTLAQNVFIDINGLYSLDVTITPNGANPEFMAILTGTNTVTFEGDLTGLGGEDIASFGAEWVTDSNPDADGDLTFGDRAQDYLIFDNVSAVPEPKVALLGALGFLALLRRRR